MVSRERAFGAYLDMTDATSSYLNRPLRPLEEVQKTRKPEWTFGKVNYRFWKPEDEAKLRADWASGLSGSVIGKRLNMSRNAIIGKARRMKLLPRKSPISISEKKI